MSFVLAVNSCNLLEIPVPRGLATPSLTLTESGPPQYSGGRWYEVG